MEVKKSKFKITDILFVVFILLLIIPQTRKPLLVGVNKVSAKISTLTVVAKDEQEQLNPFVYHLQSLEGVPINASIGDGDITFVSYWATWCPPCIAEFPSIDALYQDYGDNINFLMISNEAPEKIKRFLEKKKYSVPAVVSKMKPPKDLYEKTIPTNYIIDHTGKIIIKEKGASDWNSEKVRKILDGLIEAKDTSGHKKTLSTK